MKIRVEVATASAKVAGKSISLSSSRGGLVDEESAERVVRRRAMIHFERRDVRNGALGGSVKCEGDALSKRRPSQIMVI